MRISPSPLLSLLLCFFTLPTRATQFFVDSRNGADSNSGLSLTTAWKSMASIRAHAFVAGDTVSFVAGSAFTEILTINNTGAQGNPILFRSTGAGPKPRFTGHGIQLNASWVVVESLTVANVANLGIVINAGAIHNEIRGCEITICGGGMWISGTDNLITKNYIHDLVMVTNDPAPDNDAGAVGIWMAASRVEISYNTLVNCKGSSYDYVLDGGAVEWWADGVVLSDCYVHHNFATGCEGFMESGGRTGGGVSNSRVAYNVAVNNGWFGLFNTTGQYAVAFNNFSVDHNTIIQTQPHAGWGATRSIYFFNTTPMSVSLRNNIFHLNNWYVTDNPNITHTNNLFSLTGGGLGFTQHGTEKTGNPLFVNFDGGNYDLLVGSPAINIGMELGYPKDYMGRPALYGTHPDAGAFEYQGPALINRMPIQIQPNQHSDVSNGHRIYDLTGKRHRNISRRGYFFTP